jgi:transient receptor potential cation channel subfamily M member 3
MVLAAVVGGRSIFKLIIVVSDNYDITNNFPLNFPGPLVTMMGKMVKNMIYFVVLLLVVLMSFGVSRQAILFPNSEASWRLIREVYFQPYFMLYGEVFADDIDPPCGDDPAQSPCITGHWVTPIAMSMYLLIANILLINLLIAVFNNIFNEVNSVSHQVWMFQRFTVVMEYQQKPVLPPPMIAFCHFYSLLKYLIRKYKGLENVRDNGLKLFLEKEDMECLYDFEEECVEGYFKEQEGILLQSTEERIKNTDERVEHMSQRIEDINQKENKQTASVKDIALKIQKLEDATAQILDHLAVIHRFMATHTNMQEHFPGGSLINIGTASSGGGGGMMLEPRFRTVSETGTSSAALQLHSRRKYNRSMSEMRPDATAYDDHVSHLEVQTVLEENEYVKSPERDRKFSVQSAEEMDYIAMSPGGEAGKSVPTPPVFKSSHSGESKDTLTPVDNSDAKTLVGEEEGSMEDFVDLNYEGLRQRAIRKRMGTGRRNSETLYDIKTSQSSLNQMIPMARRQQSLTQSEPDSGNEPPATKPKVVNKRRQMLLQIHDEYTSITDELESACQLISSPTASVAEERQKTELTNPEFVALLEKQHLKECEENDYFILERLIQSRSSIDESYDNTFGGISIDFSNRRGLHRESAVELPITPSKSNTTVGDNNETTDFGVANESQFRRHLSSERKISPSSNQNSPRNSQLYGQGTYLNPGLDLKSRLYKKSCESLQKNSSTETEYSLQRPYHVIKQSSNETNTSFNSSFNIENSSSFNNELSLDGEPTSMNATVIENIADEARKMVPHLKKVPCMELGPANRLAAPEVGAIAKLHKESTSSTSTEEARDERFLPKFTTNTVQDEIAKLSSTIKSSTEDEKAETPVNETMC